MKPYLWEPDKNDWLKKNRGLCFEDVIFHIENGYLLDIIANPNQEKYENQRIYLVEIQKYVYMIPFDETEKHYFLKTIISSRKMTKKYLGA